MKSFFSKYTRFLGTIFFLWLCLKIAKIFGFDFAVNLSFFFWAFLLLSFPLIIWEIKNNWNRICEITKNVILEILTKSKDVQNLRRFRNKFGMTRELGITRDRKTEKHGFFDKIFNAGFIISIIFRFVFKELVFSKKIILPIVIFGIIFDIFIFHSTSDLLILFLTGLWIWSIRIFKFNGRVSIASTLVFLLMCPFLLILNKELIAEKSAIWAYMFLAVGVVQEFVENMRESRKGKGESIGESGKYKI